MRYKKAVKWLFSEIPAWVQEGIVTPESATQIRERYDKKLASKKPLTIILFGCLGTLLIGFGFILIFARNWDDLPKWVRIMIAFLPPVFAQLLSLWVLIKQGSSQAWREGAGGFLSLAMGGCIALIGQIYHTPVDWHDFYFSWALLTLPVVYFLRSTLSAGIFLFTITMWAASSQLSGSNALIFWPLFALLVPYLKSKYDENKSSWSLNTLAWMTTLTLTISVGVCLEKNLPGIWMPIYASLFAVLYFVGVIWFPEGQILWQQAYRTAGALGMIVILWIMSFHSMWNEIGFAYYRSGGKYDPLAGTFDYVILILLVITAVFLFQQYLSRNEKNRLVMLFGCIPILALFGYILGQFPATVAAGLFLFNVYIFFLSVAIMLRGIEENRLSLLNAGLITFALLLMSRFFDMEMSLAVRGILFILTGSGLLGANFWLIRRKSKEAFLK